MYRLLQNHISYYLQNIIFFRNLTYLLFYYLNHIFSLFMHHCVFWTFVFEIFITSFLHFDQRFYTIFLFFTGWKTRGTKEAVQLFMNNYKYSLSSIVKIYPSLINIIQQLMILTYLHLIMDMKFHCKMLFSKFVFYLNFVFLNDFLFHYLIIRKTLTSFG